MNEMLLGKILHDKQAEVLLKMNLLGSCPVYVERHISLNSLQQVITTDVPDGMFG
jgi:hypothetical protein